MNYETPLGNHVFIEGESGAIVLLAHFQKNSLLVGRGQKVQPGTPLGKIGNSGRSIEPHLHIQAASFLDWANNQPLPMKFDGQSYGLNDVARVR